MRRRKKGTSKVIDELQKQLLIQAERLGVREKYSPLWFVEQEILALGRILADFYSERANLEYELNVLGSNKKEILIKLERLHAYIRKAESLREKNLEQFERMLDKNYRLSEVRQKVSALMARKDIKTLA